MHLVIFNSEFSAKGGTNSLESGVKWLQISPKNTTKVYFSFSVLMCIYVFSKRLIILLRIFQFKGNVAFIC